MAKPCRANETTILGNLRSTSVCPLGTAVDGATRSGSHVERRSAPVRGHQMVEVGRGVILVGPVELEGEAEGEGAVNSSAPGFWGFLTVGSRPFEPEPASAAAMERGTVRDNATAPV